MPNPGEWSDRIGDRELADDAALTLRYAVMHCAQILPDCSQTHLFAHLQNILADELSLCHDFAAHIRSRSWQSASVPGQKGHLHVDSLQDG